MQATRPASNPKEHQMVTRINKNGIEQMPGGGVAFVGPDAVNVYRVLALQSAAALTLNTGMLPTRGMTKTRMRDALNNLSGSSAKNLRAALRDSVVWAEVALERTEGRDTVLDAAGLPPRQKP